MSNPKLNSKVFVLLAISFILFTSCDKDDEAAPAAENVEELITDVTLTFTNKADTTNKVVATAKDPDGSGVKGLEIINSIDLDTDKTYTLKLDIANNLTTPGVDIGKEILDEADEHQLFYSFTTNAFQSPKGDGNIDNASDVLNYKDKDANNNPLGLVTEWETSSTRIKGASFTIRLQHQPDLKTATSGATVGDTDFELTFEMNIEF